MPKCSKCKENKELGEFYKNKTTKNGVCSLCRVCTKKRSKEWYENNLKCGKNSRKKWYNKNKKQVLKRCKQYRQDNKDQLKQYFKQYRQDNSCKIKQYFKQRRQIDELFKLSGDVRNLICISFKNKGFKKASKTANILGCNYQFFYGYLMITFYNNYNKLPTNYDKLHIDHIIPISTAKTEQNVLNLCHYTNLQWLLAEDNLEKSNKLDWTLNV